MTTFKYQVRCIANGEAISDEGSIPFGGCRDDEGNISNHEVVWSFPTGPHAWGDLLSDEPGIWRYSKLLPVGTPAAKVTLGEGNTSLLRLRGAGEMLGHEHVYVKNESQNPTWSHKDRLAAAAVSKAVEMGAKGVTVASTGNHAAAAAAYAARAGIPCYVFTTTSVPQAMKTLMQSLGATVVAANDFDTRTKAMERCFREYGWWPIGNLAQPPAGSNCFGIEGYKTLAYELYEQFGFDLPDVVVLPTAYGDMTYGVYKGFRELMELGITDRVPRVVAVEPFGSLAETLEQRAPYPVISQHSRVTAAFSTAAPVSTHQALVAVRKSNGTAVACRDEQAILEVQARLGATNGLFVEAASATGVLAVRQLSRAQWFGPDERVVVVITSSGLKDPVTPGEYLGEVPLISESDPDHVRRVIADHYGFDCRASAEA